MPKLGEIAAFKSINEAMYIYPEAVGDVMAGIGQIKENGYKPVVKDGVAFIPISGAMTRKGSFLSSLFGGAVMEIIESDYLKAMNDPDVKGIVLDVDSPGGTVAGTDRLATVIRDNKTKPVIAYTGGMMASAAYYVASQADVIIADKTALAGSIGVIMTHMDMSGMAQQMGIKVTHIVAGEDKALGNSLEPLGKEGKEYLQGIVDDAYKMFKAAVSLGRGEKIDVDKVANGRVYTASNALELGLIDEIGTIETAINLAKKESEKMTLEELKAKNPEVVDALKAEIMSGIEATHVLKETVEAEKKAAIDASASDIAKAERERIAGINAAVLHDSQKPLAEKYVSDNLSVDAAIVEFAKDFSAKVKSGEIKPSAELTAEEKAKQAMLTGLEASAPAAIEHPAGAGKSAVEAFLSEKDPLKRAQIYQEHKAEIEAAAKSK